MPALHSFDVSGDPDGLRRAGGKGSELACRFFKAKKITIGESAMKKMNWKKSLALTASAALAGALLHIRICWLTFFELVPYHC